MPYEPINFPQKIQPIRRASGKPKVIAEMNDYQFKIVRLAGRLSFGAITRTRMRRSLYSRAP